METPKARRATWRLGTRERLHMQRVAVAIILLLLVIAGRPWFLGLIAWKDFQVCQSNCLRMARGLDTYRQDWDDTLPPADNWTYTLQGAMNPISGTGFDVQHYFRCPRDKSGAPSSYAYNELLAGVSLSVRPTGKEAKPQIARPERAPLIIEKHGSRRNEHLPLPDGDVLGQNLTRPHNVPPAPTGSLILGSGRVTSRNDDQLEELKGRKF